MAKLFGVAVLYFSIFFTLSGTVVGTCTQGAADEFLIGCAGGSIGYALAFAFLIARPPRRRGWLLIAPALVALGYQLYWAAGFFIAYHLQGISACGWKEHEAGFNMDGREPLLTAWWLLMSLLALAGIFVSWARGRRLAVRCRPSSPSS